MIGIDILGCPCPKCGIETLGSSAKAHVIQEALGYLLPVKASEVICYSFCPVCMAIILPVELLPSQNQH